MKLTVLRTALMALSFGATLINPAVQAAESEPELDPRVDRLDNDTHYSSVGFFDVHVCNWPERGLFYMLVFSTVKYEDVKQVKVFTATGQELAVVDPDVYRTHPKNPKKRIFITMTGLADVIKDGWFTAKIEMKDGTVITSKDYVIHGAMGYASDLQPPDKSALTEAGTTFKWKPPVGSTHWVVTVRDTWNNDAVVFTSGALTKPELVLPAGVVKKGGEYSWRVHSRDNNGNILLGDFNHGSMSLVTNFTVSQ